MWRKFDGIKIWIPAKPTPMTCCTLRTAVRRANCLVFFTIGW